MKRIWIPPDREEMKNEAAQALKPRTPRRMADGRVFIGSGEDGHLEETFNPHKEA